MISALERLKKYGLRWRMRQRATNHVMRRVLDSNRHRKAEDAFETSRVKHGRGHEVHYFHQTDDPYSALTAQALPALLARYDIKFIPHVVPPPGADMVPVPQLTESYNRRDAAAIAPFYGLAFEDKGHPASARESLFAARLLTACEKEEFAELAPKVSACLWAKDKEGLKQLAGNKKLPSHADMQHLMHDNAVMRDKMGHFNSAMFYYGGVWYWGIDRLHYLEARLERVGARRSNAPAGLAVQRRPLSTMPENYQGKKMELDYFFSLRSPYSYLSIPRSLALAENYPVKVNIRPILPMVMRNLPVPRRKGLYIMYDTKREADTLGMPFGDFLDPVGPPVKRAYSLLPYIAEEGKLGEYFDILLTSAWSQRRDIFRLSTLRKIIEEDLGLSWERALPLLDSDDWQEQVEDNRQALLAAGCWGAPSYCLRGTEGEADFSTWGQDRIWRVEEEIIRRARAAN